MERIGLLGLLNGNQTLKQDFLEGLIAREHSVKILRLLVNSLIRYKRLKISGGSRIKISITLIKLGLL